nr:MAG TPA: hypothetical protein [Caudoviricetes sp.]
MTFLAIIKTRPFNYICLERALYGKIEYVKGL